MSVMSRRLDGPEWLRISYDLAVLVTLTVLVKVSEAPFGAFQAPQTRNRPSRALVWRKVRSSRLGITEVRRLVTIVWCHALTECQLKWKCPWK